MEPKFVMRRIAVPTLKPTFFAAVVPKIIRKMMVKPYSQYASPFNGANKKTKRDSTPPTANATPEAK